MTDELPPSLARYGAQLADALRREIAQRPQPCEHELGDVSGFSDHAAARVLATPGTSAFQVRAAAAELPRVGLEDAMAILLGLLDREPATFPRAAARWGARLTLERRLALPDAQLTLAALAMLPAPDAQAGAEALIELAERNGLRRVDELLNGWLRRTARGD